MKTELQWIQALRGIAALMVLFFHMAPHWDLTPALAVFTGAMRWGFSGVDIFFTLSGFVVYLSAKKSIPSGGFTLFMKKRLLRIYLGYWPVLVLISVVTIYCHDAKLPSTEKIIFSTLLLYPNIWDNWLAPAWSLTLEIYFYLWIAIIALLTAKSPVKAIVVVMAFLAGWGLFWLLRDSEMVFEGQQPLRYLFTGLGIEFLAGALVAEMYDRRHWLLSHGRWTMAASGVLMVVGVCVGMTSPYFDRVEVMRAATFGLAGLGALLLFLSLENTKFRPPTWLVMIGNASYSLYLLHTFLLDASGRIRFENGIADGPALLTFLIAMPVIIILISLLWYQWVERPIMKAAQLLVKTPRHKVPNPA